MGPRPSSQSIRRWMARTLGRALGLLGVAAGALAVLDPRPPGPTGGKVHVAIRWLSADETLVFTATTERHGTSYVDRWSVTPSLVFTSATSLDSSAPRSASYVSTARVSESALAPDTTYTFSYSIFMRAGQDAWAGSDSVSITIGPERELPAE